MANVIDRRTQSKNKSAVNRDRFLKRYKGKIKEAVSRSISSRSITDIEKGTGVSVPGKDITEPYFGHGNGGIWDHVSPGNSDYQKGDVLPRPRGRGMGGPSDSGDPFDDDFIFTLTKEEFMEYFFDDLALPDMIKKRLKDSTSVKHQRAGYKTSGSTSNIHVLRSLKGALGRRLSLGGKTAKRLKEAEKELNEILLDSTLAPDDARLSALLEEIISLKSRLAKIPFIDDIDIRYANTVPVQQPSSKAVMFCIMDVSGSMDQYKKDIAKRFFILLYLFLTKEYKAIDVVFIRHHTEAQEVSEHEFFHSRESGGTVVSSALNLMGDIIKERYSDNCNIYVAQASDGDNFESDSIKCREIITTSILPAVQYYTYIEIADMGTQNLWDHYELIASGSDKFVIRNVFEASDIYPVFRDLFKKEGAV